MEAFLADVQMFACNFAPQGWALCNGQILSIAQNTALFSLLGTTYGGNGQTTFALPNLQGRMVIGMGQGPGLTGRTLGEQGGESTTTLTIAQMPAHSHAMAANSGNGTSANPVNNILSTPGADRDQHLYGSGAMVTMGANTIGIGGGSQPHNNMQPFLGLYYCIATVGIYPSRN